MGTEDLEQLIAHMRQIGNDTQTCEVKEASSKLPESVVETLSAFSNGTGGTLILGLSDKHNVSDLVLLEGMMCAMVPLVTASLDIQYLIQHNRNGLIAGTTAEELVDCLCRISSAELPLLARAAEESARRVASLQHVATQHRNIFHGITAK